MRLEDEILKLGYESPLSEARLRSLLKRTLKTLRRNHPQDFDGRTDDEIIEEIVQTRQKELAFISGLAQERRDRYGRSWALPKEELCSECGQPDSCGDCTHEKLTDAQATQLGALGSRDGDV